MFKQDSKEKLFDAAFHAWQEQRTDAPWVEELRRTAFASFTEQGLPTRRDEEWKYTSLRPLGQTPYSLPSLVPDDAELTRTTVAPYIAAGDIALVVVNGQLSTELSQLGTLPPGLSIVTLTEALRTRGDELRTHLSSKVKQPFTHLNEAFLGSGLVIELATKTACPSRVHLIHVSTAAAEGTTFAPRHLILLAAQSELKVAETFLATSADTRYFANPHTEISLSAGAKLRHERIQTEGAKAVHVGRGHATLQRDATLDSFCFSAGAQLGRYDLHVVMQGEGAEAILDGLYLARSGQVVDHHTSIDHSVPNAASRQLYKGILGGDGRAIFNGKVFVRREAQGTNALQMNRNLLLSSEAEVDTKPELQIDADDVKCAHGASIGQLEDDQIFYLLSRGLNPTEAQQILTQAFADEVLAKAPSALPWLRPLTMGYFT